VVKIKQREEPEHCLKINQIYNMKCEEGIPLLGDNTVDLVITSPPYNVNRSSYADDLPYEEYLDWMEYVFSLIYPKLRTGGKICVNIGERKNGRIPLTSHLTQRLERIKYLPYTKIVWNKQHTSCRTAWGSWKSPSCPSFPSPVEYILVFCKEKYSLQKAGISDLTKEEFISWAYGLWKFPTERRMRKFGHDAMFPEELPKRCIKMFSWIGDLVFDPFSGVGTTALVASKLKRNFIGFENVKKHYETSLKRLEKRKFQLL